MATWTCLVRWERWSEKLGGVYRPAIGRFKIRWTLLMIIYVCTFGFSINDRIARHQCHDCNMHDWSSSTTVCIYPVRLGIDVYNFFFEFIDRWFRRSRIPSSSRAQNASKDGWCVHTISWFDESERRSMISVDPIDSNRTAGSLLRLYVTVLVE